MMTWDDLKWLFGGWGGEPKKVRVNAYSMMGSAAVWYCLNKISGDVGKMPLEPRRTLPDGRGSEPMTSHPSWKIFRDEANAFQTSDVFKEQLMGHALGWGNGRAAIIRDNRGAVSELLPLMPDRSWIRIVEGEKFHLTTPTIWDDLSYPVYEMNRIDQTGVIGPHTVVLPDRDVLHIQGFGTNGYSGMSIGNYVARESIGIELRAQRYQNRGLDKGFAASLMLEDSANVFRNEDEAKKFLDNFNEAYGGQDKAKQAALIRQGVKAHVLNMSNKDAEFIEQRRFNRQDMMLWFGMQHIPGDSSATSYNSLEQKQREYLASTLDKWLVRWEMQCDSKLRTQKQKESNNVYFKFNRATWLSTDTATTQAVLSGYVASEIMSPNEAREIIDMNPREGGDEFANPAINPADNEPPEPNEAEEEMVAARMAYMLELEAGHVINGTSKNNYLDWLEGFYSSWQMTLVRNLSPNVPPESIRDIIASHKEDLLKATDNVKTEAELKQAVTETTKGWK